MNIIMVEPQILYIMHFMLVCEMSCVVYIMHIQLFNNLNVYINMLVLPRVFLD